jgi:hypothetical protein
MQPPRFLCDAMSQLCHAQAAVIDHHIQSRQSHVIGVSARDLTHKSLLEVRARSHGEKNQPTVRKLTTSDSNPYHPAPSCFPTKNRRHQSPSYPNWNCDPPSFPHPSVVTDASKARGAPIKVIHTCLITGQPPCQLSFQLLRVRDYTTSDRIFG